MIHVLKLLLLLITTQLAVAQDSQWYSINDNKQVTLNVELFMTTTCPHCKKAEAFLNQLEEKKPWIRVKRYYINKNKEDLLLFHQKLRKNHVFDFKVPSIIFCGVRWVGFESAQSTGKELTRVFQYCRNQIQKEGTLTPMTEEILTRWSLSPFELDSSKDTSELLIVAGTALIDAFNPCSLFAFLLFLSFLLLMKSRMELIIVGLLMIISFGLTHYLQQAQVVLYYQLLLWFRWPTLLVGIGLLLYSLMSFFKIRLTAFAYILALVASFTTLLYQQSCIETNLSLFYQQWLVSQVESNFMRVLYQLIYQMIYLVPLIMILILSFYIHSGSRWNKYKNYFTFIGQLALIAISLIMIAHPSLFSDRYWSFALTFFVVLTGWLAVLIKSKRSRG